MKLKLEVLFAKLFFVSVLSREIPPQCSLSKDNNLELKLVHVVSKVFTKNEIAIKKLEEEKQIMC